MFDYLHHFLFGILPYVALAIFFIGSLIRFDREQYTWRSGSSQSRARRPASPETNRTVSVGLPDGVDTMQFLLTI